MTMIVFDYADIRSRMKGEDKSAPKKKAEPVPEPMVFFPADWKPRPGIRPLSEAAKKAWLTGDWSKPVQPINAELQSALRVLLKASAPNRLLNGRMRVIAGIDPAKPDSDTTVVWRRMRDLIVERNGEVREDDA